MKDFISSFLLICGWLCIAISAYLLFWTVVTPLWAFTPFCISISLGLVYLYFKKTKIRRH